MANAAHLKATAYKTAADVLFWMNEKYTNDNNSDELAYIILKSLHHAYELGEETYKNTHLEKDVSI